MKRRRVQAHSWRKSEAPPHRHAWVLRQAEPPAALRAIPGVRSGAGALMTLLDVRGERRRLVAGSAALQHVLRRRVIVSARGCVKYVKARWFRFEICVAFEPES